MTDSTPWQSPSGPERPADQSPFATRGAPSPYGPPPQGWAPPPKPGLIPLRPLGLGTVLAASFQVLRRNPRPTFGFSLAVYAISSLLGLAVVGVVAFAGFSRALSATGPDQDALLAGAGAMTILSALVPVALSIVAAALLQGVIALEVARGTVGEKHTVGSLLRAARGRIGALIGWTALVAGTLVVAIGVLGGLVALLIAFGGTAGLVVGILLGLLLAAGVAALAFWLTTKLAFVPSVLLLERVTLRQAMGRSWALTRGVFWRTLGILLLVAVIISVATQVVSTPFSFVLGISGALLNPTEAEGPAMVTFVVTYVLLLLFSVLFAALAAVVQSATPALLYLDARMRKEGLDLELVRFVEARQTGRTDVPDPYLVRSGQADAAAAPGAPWS